MRSREPATETSLLFLSRKGCGRSRVHQGQNSGGRHAGHVPTSGGERPTVVLRERKHPRGVFFFLPPSSHHRGGDAPRLESRPSSRQSLNRCYPAPLDFPGDVSVAPSARSGWGASARGFDAALALTLRSRREPKKRLVSSASQKSLPLTNGLSDLSARAGQPVPRRPLLRRRVDVCAAEPKTVAVVSPQLGTSQALRERRLSQIFPVTWQGELDEDDDDRRERGGAARHGEG